MLTFSNPERRFILTLLILGTLCLGLSYYRNTQSTEKIETIAIKEPSYIININKATALELERLPGIGPTLAMDIVIYREKIDGFKDIEDLKHIKGIGDKKFKKIMYFITVSE